MKKVLAISNSFGVDANRHLYDISRSMVDSIKIVTLYIEGMQSLPPLQKYAE